MRDGNTWLFAASGGWRVICNGVYIDTTFGLLSVVVFLFLFFYRSNYCGFKTHAGASCVNIRLQNTRLTENGGRQRDAFGSGVFVFLFLFNVCIT